MLCRECGSCTCLATEVWDWRQRKPGENTDKMFIGAGRGLHIPDAETAVMGQGITRKHCPVENSHSMEQELLVPVAYATVGKTKR